MSDNWELPKVAEVAKRTDQAMRDADFMEAFRLSSGIVSRTEHALLKDVGLGRGLVSLKWFEARRHSLLVGSEALVRWTATADGDPTMLKEAFCYRRAAEMKLDGRPDRAVHTAAERLHTDALLALAEQFDGPDGKRFESNAETLHQRCPKDPLLKFSRMANAFVTGGEIVRLAKRAHEPTKYFAADLGCRTLADYPNLVGELKAKPQGVFLASSVLGHWIVGMSSNEVFSIDLDKDGKFSELLPPSKPALSDITDMTVPIIEHELGTAQTVSF